MPSKNKPPAAEVRAREASGPPAPLLPERGSELTYRSFAGGAHRAVVTARWPTGVDLDVYLPGQAAPAISLSRVPFVPVAPSPGQVRVCFPRAAAEDL